MPIQRIPAAPLGGVTSRRHSELLLHLVQSGGRASVKDLRLRRVIPPASAPPLDSSPEGAAAKPGSVESTPPEAAAAQDRELKPMLPRSKLVRDPASFGYRRLLPFLNKMAKNDNSKKELNRSHFVFVDESVDGSHGEAHPMDSVESVVVETGGDQQMKDCCSNAQEETKIVPDDLSYSKPWLTRCPRSRFVHHPSSFSYKRMLPFLMENELSSQEGDRVKIRRVMEEKQLISDKNDALPTGQHHLAVSEDSPEECNRSEVERIVEEKPSKSDVDYVLDCGQLQSAVSEVSPLEGGPAEMQQFRQEVLTSDGGPLSSDEGGLTSDGNDVLTGRQSQLAVSEDSPEESNRAEVEKTQEEEELKSDGNFVLDGRQLQPAVSEVSPPEDSAAEMQKTTQKQALTPDGDEGNPLTSYKGEFLAKEQPQLSITEELLKDNGKLAEVQQCQSSESGCSYVGFASPTKTVIPLVNRHSELEQQDSVASLDDPLLDVVMICRPSDPCAIGTPLSVEEMSGCVMHAESGSSKVSTLRPRGSPCLEKRGLSPKKLSPKKGILKRHTRGCKGICMCLDCSIFRLHADRDFEFSRKQMQEADDIIGDLLKEVASLRCLVEKSAGQQESAQAACRRASRVEEVVGERRRQMLMELNSHGRIPGPRVKFAQYIEEKCHISITSRHGDGHRRGNAGAKEDGNDDDGSARQLGGRMTGGASG